MSSHGISQSIPIDQFVRIAFDGDAARHDAIAERVRLILQKNSVDSIAEVRKAIMGLDRQTFPTPVIVRFSPTDIEYLQVNGVSCPIDTHDLSVSVPPAHTGVYEAHLVACFRRYCKSGDTVLDIGANVGFHSMFLSRTVGASGHVFAFEPNSENCRLILAAKEKNKAENVTLMPFALSDKRGWSYFSSHIGSNGGFISEQTVTLHGHGSVVPTFTLDELGLPAVDFIKIDVEGAEHKALHGGRKLIESCRPIIACEFSMEMISRVSGIPPAQFLSWILGLGYRMFVLDRSSFQPQPIGTLDNFLSSWGDPCRIEDLLFLPQEVAST